MEIIKSGLSHNTVWTAITDEVAICDHLNIAVTLWLYLKIVSDPVTMV